MAIRIITFVSIFLFTTSILARRNGDAGLSQNNSTAESTSTDENWAGVVLAAPPLNTTFSAIIGTFTVPDLKPPQSVAMVGVWKGSAWVGIDGAGGTKSILQAGISWEVSRDIEGNLTKSYGAWYEWYPNAMAPFLKFKISAGDTVTTVCQLTSSNSTGMCAVQNENTGLTVSIDMSAPGNSSAIAGKTAEWIVEDFSVNNRFADFADFGKVEWTKCQAGAAPIAGVNGESLVMFAPSESENRTVVDIAQSPGNLTTTETTGSNITISYGPRHH